MPHASQTEDLPCERSFAFSALLPIAAGEIGGAPVQTVDGRTLHAFLEIGRDFSTWMKDRIDAYGFVEGVDYVTSLLPNFGEKGRGRPSKEFHLTLDMAKELAMVERNEKGKQARTYFIACERQVLAQLQSLAVPRGTAAEQIERTFGITRQTNGKVTNLERQVEALSTEVGALTYGLVHPDHLIASAVLDEAKVPSKGRRPLVTRTTNGLAKYSRQHGFDVPREFLTRRKLYHRKAIAGWRAVAGDALIARHLDAVCGQGRLQLSGRAS